MKRGIPIAWQAAGAVLACLVTTLNHPVIAYERIVSVRDTAYYYNEHGTQLYCDTKAVKPGSYVIKTSKTHRQIFDDWYDRDTTVFSKDYKPAEVLGIERWEARKTRRLIHRGNVNDTLVQRCIVPVPDKRLLRIMLDSILNGRIKDAVDGKFREYGGMINGDKTFRFKRGYATDPRKPENEGLEMELGENGNFHSHPDGCYYSEDKDSAHTFNPNRVDFVEHRRGHKYYFIQGPSNKDQDAIGDKTGYVFGMEAKLIYLYDKHGVRAVLPFKYLPPGSVNK
ncbi:hypothetical protein A4D02_11600 [Niastella koreensis]|uniref:Uncharacterized protein n=2 Tax=Niastella koreensis TaxID=354356 RepID=G8TFZ1_NIAKG|nr:hypothetical protein [Niastella koreensis]AEW00590.1 hypothetical protein Niako_4330 [Niastella koreensis GR20-10]OQP42229.1 hypothetical protein A4D02_11600 [Niastella koreensis]